LVDYLISDPYFD